MLRAELRSGLHYLGDLERLTNRIISGHALPRDLVSARSSLRGLPALKAVFADQPGPLNSILQNFGLCPEQLELLEQAIQEDPPATLQNTGIIRPGYSAELDNVVEASRHAREWISNLEKRRTRTHWHQDTQSRIQQSIWIFYRSDPQQYLRCPAGLHTQTNPGECRTLHYAGDERI